MSVSIALQPNSLPAFLRGCKVFVATSEYFSKAAHFIFIHFPRLSLLLPFFLLEITTKYKGVH